MRDLPILMSAPMVQGCLREVDVPGTGKTQTRRIINLPGIDLVEEFVKVGTDKDGVPVYEMKDVAGRHVYVPKGKHFTTPHYSPRFVKGDSLWVREAWRTEIRNDDIKPSELRVGAPLYFEAGGGGEETIPSCAGRLRPGMFMPRWASRLTLTVVDMRLERLQDISEADAIAEGVVDSRDGYFTVPGVAHPNKDFPILSRYTAREMYAALWDVINGSGAWLKNPWIVAIAFSVQRRNIDAVTP